MAKYIVIKNCFIPEKVFVGEEVEIKDKEIEKQLLDSGAIKKPEKEDK